MSLSALTVILFNRCDTQLWLMVVDHLVACTEDNTRCLDAIRILSDLWFQASAATAAMPAVPTCAAEASAAAPAMPAATSNAGVCSCPSNGVRDHGRLFNAQLLASLPAVSSSERAQEIPVAS